MKNPIVLNNLFTSKNCNDIIEYSKKKNVDFEPFSNSPYRSAITKSELSNIDDGFIYKIEKLVSNTLKNNFIVDTITIHYKDKWVGAEEHWHQDYPYNLINYNDEPKNFYRVFIALDEHTKKNGCMMFIENSHQEGIMEHEKILSIHSYQKNRVKTNIIDACYKKYGIKYFPLGKGNGILFNSLILHSSCSNQSPHPRKALQIQFVKENTKKKLPSEISIFLKNRKLFEINELQKRINNKQNLKGEFQYIFKHGKNGTLEYIANDETFEKIYQDKKDPWDQTNITDEYYYVTRNKLVEILNQRYANINNLLEIGCGNGFSTNFIKQNINKKCNVYGIDISPTAIYNAKKYSNIDFLTHNIKNPINLDVKFDIIIFGDLLWYILNDLKICIDNAFESLSKTGKIIFYNAFLENQRYGTNIIDGFDGFINFCKKNNYNIDFSFQSKLLNHKKIGLVILSK